MSYCVNCGVELHKTAERCAASTANVEQSPGQIVLILQNLCNHFRRTGIEDSHIFSVCHSILLDRGQITRTERIKNTCVVDVKNAAAQALDIEIHCILKSHCRTTERGIVAKYCNQENRYD